MFPCYMIFVFISTFHNVGALDKQQFNVAVCHKTFFDDFIIESSFFKKNWKIKILKLQK